MESIVLDEFCQEISNGVSQWRAVGRGEMREELLTGTSNKVYRVWNILQIHPISVIFRIFGPNEVTDKSRERKIFNYLSQLNLGPRILFETSVFRIEEYLENFRPLNYEDLSNPSIICAICQKLKSIHALKMPEVLQGEGEIIYNHLSKWKKLGNQKLDLIENNDYKIKVKELLSDLTYERFLNLVPKTGELSFVHFDTNFYNILLKEDDLNVALIDFEFSGLGFKAFDLAFLLSDMRFDYLVSEWPGFRFERMKAPSDELVGMWVEAYGGGSGFLDEVKKCFLACNYFWAVWDLAMWVPGRSGFDHLENCIVRFDEFMIESE
jgi:thiamine kinase-like enzyme